MIAAAPDEDLDFLNELEMDMEDAEESDDLGFSEEGEEDSEENAEEGMGFDDDTKQDEY